MPWQSFECAMVKLANEKKKWQVDVEWKVLALALSVGVTGQSCVRILGEHCESSLFGVSIQYFVDCTAKVGEGGTPTLNASRNSTCSVLSVSFCLPSFGCPASPVFSGLQLGRNTKKLGVARK